MGHEHTTYEMPRYRPKGPPLPLRDLGLTAVERAVAGAVPGPGTLTFVPMPHLQGAGGLAAPVEPSLCEALDSVEKMAADARDRVSSLRVQLLGHDGGGRADTGALTGPSMTSRLNAARLALADTLGDIAAIERALGLREP